MMRVVSAVRTRVRPTACSRNYSILPSISEHGDRIALIDRDGPHTYAYVRACAQALTREVTPLKAPDSRQPRIAILCPRNVSYVKAQWAAWMSGGIAVPLADSYPAKELAYFLEDARPSVMLTTTAMRKNVQGLLDEMKIRAVCVDEVTAGVTAAHVSAQNPPAASGDGAMLIYTSGTTSKPKGVLSTHSNLQAQMSALTTAWQWAPSDRLLHVLPLHHVHGVLAALLCAHSVGAAVEMLPKFDAAATWAALTRAGSDPSSITVFMAVPTVYAKLLEHARAQGQDATAAWGNALKNKTSRMRLMVSGSAALPEPIMREWRAVTGHTLLERFGMTEFGMAISNSYTGARIPNSVGKPLPGYEARIVDDTDASGSKVVARGATGELQIRGKAVFSEYWNKPAATAETFTADGWFRTGDAVHEDADGNIFIHGRLSADIIKSGGYKISALEIERILLDHPAVHEVVVVGAPDVTYGERVAAVVVPKPGSAMASADAASRNAGAVTSLREWAKDKLAHYKLPTVAVVLPEIPRNAMGKVNKKALKAQLFP